MAVLKGRGPGRRLSLGYWDFLLAAFLLGAVGGTVAANLAYPKLEGQAGNFAHGLGQGLGLPAKEQLPLFLWVCKQRVGEMMFAWIIGLTVFSVPCFCLLAAGLGLSIGMVVSVATCQMGLMGLPWYLATMFPHGLLYMPAWLVLARWAGGKDRRLHLAPMAALVLMTLAGGAAESWINPIFLKMVKFF